MKKLSKKKQNNKMGIDRVEQQEDIQDLSDETVGEQIKQSPKKVKKRINKKDRKRKASIFRNMKIAPRLLLGFLIIALLCAGMGTYAAFNLLQVGESVNVMYEDMLLPVRTLSTLADTFNAGCTDLRQALLADDSNLIVYVSTLNSNSMKYTSTLTMLESLITGDAQDSYQTLKTAYDTYGSLYKEAIDKIEAGKKQEVLDDLMHFGELRTSEDKVSKALSDLKYTVTEDATSHARMSKDTASQVFTITIGVAGAVLILSVLIGLIMARGFSRPIKKLAANIKRLAAGETDFELSEASSKDEIGEMRDAVSTILGSVKELENDTDMLIGAVMEGQLSVRADAEKHQGTYRRIVEGINATLDATIVPIKESAEVLSEISQGNLDVSVIGDFKGDFALIKDALNSTTETLKRYIDEISRILGSIAAGDMTVSITSEFRGSFLAL
jgi:methyl-accepting chemotaxis protein